MEQTGQWPGKTGKISFVEQDNPNDEADNGNFLYCKTCKREISAETRTCPHCGTDDPMMMKKKKIGSMEAMLAFVTIPTVLYGITLPFGAEDSIGWKIGVTIATVIVYILYLIARNTMIAKENNSIAKQYEEFLKSMNKEGKIPLWRKLRDK